VIKYSDIESHVTSQLALVRDDSGLLRYYPTPMTSPGPATDEGMQKINSERLIFLSVGGGAGREVEGLFAKPFINVRSIGKQFSYEDSEQLAIDIDAAFMAIDSNGFIGNAPVLYVAHSGGEPMFLSMDAANRYHFTCSYIVETQTEGVRA
jgi:hypothetical protein